MADERRTARKMGRPSGYTPEIAAEICAAVADGSNLSRIAKRPGMPKRTAMHKWLREQPPFAHDYARAREDRGDGRNDQIDQITADVRAKKIDASSARVMIDALKWQAAHEAPKRYGDRLELAGEMTVNATLTVAETLRRRREKRDQVSINEAPVPKL